jgi:hypothetical protein
LFGEIFHKNRLEGEVRIKINCIANFGKMQKLLPHFLKNGKLLRGKELAYGTKRCRDKQQRNTTTYF